MMIDDIKRALVKLDDPGDREEIWDNELTLKWNSSKWLRALVEYYEAAEANIPGEPTQRDACWKRFYAARKNLES